MITSTEICRLWGLQTGVLRGWIAAGAVSPAVPSPGGGRGRTSHFTVRQAIALGVAAGLYRGGRGCKAPTVKLLMDRLEGMTDRDLDKTLETAGPYLLAVNPDGTWQMARRKPTPPAPNLAVIVRVARDTESLSLSLGRLREDGAEAVFPAG